MRIDVYIFPANFPTYRYLFPAEVSVTEGELIFYKSATVHLQILPENRLKAFRKVILSVKCFIISRKPFEGGV